MNLHLDWCLSLTHMEQSVQMDPIPPEFENLLLREGEPEATIKKYLLLCSESRIREDYSLLSRVFPEENTQPDDENTEKDNTGDKKGKKKESVSTNPPEPIISSEGITTVAVPDFENKQAGWETTAAFDAFANALILENRDRADSVRSVQPGRAWPLYAGMEAVERVLALPAGSVEEQFLLWIARMSAGWRSRIRHTAPPLPPSSSSSSSMAAPQPPPPPPASMFAARRYRLSTSIARLFRDRDARELRNRIVQDGLLVNRVFGECPALRSELLRMIMLLKEHFFTFVAPAGSGGGQGPSASGYVRGGSIMGSSGGGGGGGGDGGYRGEKGGQGVAVRGGVVVNFEEWNRTVKRLEDMDKEEEEARKRAVQDHEAEEKAMMKDLWDFLMRDEPDPPPWFDLDIDFGC